MGFPEKWQPSGGPGNPLLRKRRFATATSRGVTMDAKAQPMLLYDKPSLEKWSPDFSSSGQSSPVWTRLKYGQVELCNSLEWTDWTPNPVQVQICDACGTPGCASGGYVHISVLNDLVLWTVPQPSGDQWTRQPGCHRDRGVRIGCISASGLGFV